ncbi:MAG: transcriptional activator RfaH [Polaromonas sp.]|jgi:transcriptional antiterminator RfaH|nr:transcriptional activator RfaH [Polaromonas sp.]
MWFLAYSRPRLESVALQNLQHQGFNAYFPLYKCLKKTESGVHAAFEPMFPRYIFFRPSHANQSIGPVRSTRGVGHIVSFGHAPAIIRPDTLRAIQRLEQGRNAVDVTELCNLRPGTAVRFADPAFVGLQGLVKSVSSQRVSVLLEIMGREQIVTVDRHQLEVAC